MQISPAEIEVMKVLWAQAPRSAAQVAAELGPRMEWTDRTVKTLLARLVEKGALATEAEGRRYLYTPLVTQADYRRRAAGQFIDKLFEGRAAPLVAHLADDRGLTKDDIEDLEALLKDLKDDV